MNCDCKPALLAIRINRFDDYIQKEVWVWNIKVFEYQKLV